MMNHPLKGDWQAIVGKTIDRVVVRRRPQTPKCQIHLVFTDGSTFEIYSGEGEYIAGSSRLYHGDLAQVSSQVPAGGELRVYEGSTDSGE